MKQLGKWSENAEITEASRRGGLSRREFVRAATGVVAAVVGSQAEGLEAGQPGNRRQPAGGRLLLKGGVVLTFDATLGDFEKADVLRGAAEYQCYRDGDRCFEDDRSAGFYRLAPS